MEVAGLALGAVSLGMVVCEGIHTLYSDISGADKETTHLRECNEDFKNNVITRIKDLIDNRATIATADRSSIEISIIRATGILTGIQGDLEKFQRHNPKSLRSAVEAVKWAAYRKAKLLDMCTRLEPAKTTLEAMLLIIHMEETKTSSETIEAILGNQQTQVKELNTLGIQTLEAAHSVKRDVAGIQAHTTEAIASQTASLGAHIVEIKTSVSTNQSVLTSFREEVRDNIQLVLCKLERANREAAGLHVAGIQTPHGRKAARGLRSRWKGWTVGSVTTAFGTLIFTTQSARKYFGSNRYCGSEYKASATFFLPARWLYSIEAVLHFSSVMWGLGGSVRLRNIVPHGHRAFELIAKGDTDGVFQMIDRREISVWDTEEMPYAVSCGQTTKFPRLSSECSALSISGGTLLHHAAFYGNMDLCAGLIAMGADEHLRENAVIVNFPGMRRLVPGGLVTPASLVHPADIPAGFSGWDEPSLEDPHQDIDLITFLMSPSIRAQTHQMRALALEMYFAVLFEQRGDPGPGMYDDVAFELWIYLVREVQQHQDLDYYSPGMKSAFIYSHRSECSFVQLTRFLRPPGSCRDNSAASYPNSLRSSYQRWVWNTIITSKPRVTVPTMNDVCEFIDLASTSLIPRDIFLSAASAFEQAVGPATHWTVSQDLRSLEAIDTEPFNIFMTHGLGMADVSELTEISWRTKWIFSTSVIHWISIQILIDLTRSDYMRQLELRINHPWRLHSTALSKRTALFWIIWAPLLDKTYKSPMFDQVALWDCLFIYFARRDANHHPLRILWLLSCNPHDPCYLSSSGLFSPSQYRFDFFHTTGIADNFFLAHCFWFISSALETPSGLSILKEILKISHEVYRSYSPYEQSEDEFFHGTYVWDKHTLKELSATFLDSLERRWPGLCPCNGFNMAKVHRFRKYFATADDAHEEWTPPECFSRGVVCPDGRFWCNGDFQFYQDSDSSCAGDTWTTPGPTQPYGDLQRQQLGQSVVVEPSTPNSHAMPTENPFERQHNAMGYEKPESRRQGDKPPRGRSPFVQISVFVYALGAALGAMALVAMFGKAS